MLPGKRVTSLLSFLYGATLLAGAEQGADVVSEAPTKTCVINPADGTCLTEPDADYFDPDDFMDDEEEDDQISTSWSFEEIEDYAHVGYGEPQQVAGDRMDEVRERLEKMIEYMTEARTDPDYDPQVIENDCKNRHELCAFWAVIGECEENPGYMQVNCAPACLSCDKLSFENRCPTPENATNAWGPGDLDKMFERITTDPWYQQFSPKVLARPGQKNPRTGDSPWVVVLENFVKPEECKTLIELGATRGYERSTDVGDKQFDGSYGSVESSGRTSTNTWCIDECLENPTTRQVLDRLENLTGIPDANAEHLQLLRYEETQYYQVHHDYISHHLNRPCGVRMLTVFLYLNDVEAGGGTRFPDLDITVMPKEGQALLWPSVKNDKPHDKDHRTDHTALPVEKGIKFAANAWYHQRDFKTPHHTNCI